MAKDDLNGNGGGGGAGDIVAGVDIFSVDPRVDRIFQLNVYTTPWDITMCDTSS